MKILQVIPSVAPGFGGPSQAIMGLSAALARLGHEVTVFTTNADTKGTLNVPLGIPVRVDNFQIQYFPVRFPRGYKFSPKLSHALKKTVRSFDLVHIHSLFQFSTLAASHYCRECGVPYIIRPLGHLDPYALRHRFILKKVYFELCERAALNKAARIHFTTEDEMRLTLPLGLRALPAVLGLGLELAQFESLPPPGAFKDGYPQLKDKKIILFLSRINFKKGLDVLIRAFAGLCKKREDLYLVIAGPDDGYKGQVLKWIAETGLFDRVIFTGLLGGEKKLAVLRDSTIFALPSYSENFGIAVAEAMAAGLPVIISDRVGLHRDIAAAGAGLVIEPVVEQLQQSMEKLLNDPLQAQEMAVKAKKLVAEKFEWDSVALRMSEVYRAILNSRSL